MDPRTQALHAHLSRQVLAVPPRSGFSDELDHLSEGSDSSVENDVAVEESVYEDMDKFQDSVKGIAERYRLIKRIGEGHRELAMAVLGSDSRLTGLRYFFDCVHG